MKDYRPYTGRDRISEIMIPLAVLAMLALIAAALIALKPRECEMPPIEEEQWDREKWQPQPAAQPLVASYALTLADAEARLDRHNADVKAAWAEHHAPDIKETPERDAPAPEPIAPPEDEVRAAAKLLGNAAGYGECYEGETTDKVKVMWVVLNRVESPIWPDTVISVITQPGQFYGYRASTVPSDESLQIAWEVLTAWYNGDYSTRCETSGDKIYLYFSGGGGRENVFRERY